MNTTLNPRNLSLVTGSKTNTDKCFAKAMESFNEQAIVEGSRWLLKAALNGHSEAAYMIAEICRKEGNGHRAFRWYRQAALRGNIEAMKKVAIAYSEGSGVVVDKSKAAYWALRVASAMPDCEDVSAEDATEKHCRRIA